VYSLHFHISQFLFLNPMLISYPFTQLSIPITLKPN